ncbi:MAG: hypothetical protein ACK4N5_27445, partial [Myxococcales bacterium]
EDREDCPKCGLVFALFRPELFELPPALEQAWSELRGRWSDTGRHEAFLAACATAEALPEAVRRYRVVAEENPADALAPRFRDEAVARLMAIAGIQEKPAPPEPAKPPKLLQALFVVMFLVALGVALLQFLPHPESP